MKSSLQPFAMLFLCIFFVSCAATTVSNFEVVEYGLVTAKEKKWKKTEDENFGRTHIIKNINIEEQTINVPAKIGTRFGMRYLVQGEPKGRSITVQYVGLHPELSNPRTGKTFSSYKYEKKVKIGETNYMGFTFDHDWELKEGKWTLQVLYQDKIMAEQTFIISK
jgi:hypothetical protein